MGNFQTQSQWENEQESEIITNDLPSQTKSWKNNYTFLYIAIGIIFFAVLFTMLSIYHFARPIEGTWIRQADDNYGAEGMTVEVIKVNGMYEGKVTSDSDDTSKFKEGQIKWYQLKKVGFGVYECYDLCQDDTTKDYSYNETVSTLTVLAGGKTLTLDCQKHSAGAHQIWTKQEYQEKTQ